MSIKGNQLTVVVVVCMFPETKFFDSIKCNIFQHLQESIWTMIIDEHFSFHCLSTKPFIGQLIT